MVENFKFLKISLNHYNLENNSNDVVSNILFHPSKNYILSTGDDGIIKV